MTISPIEDLLVTQVFAWLIIFSRVGGGIMVMPGFGEMYVTPRARLLLALAISIVLVPLLEPAMPPIPDSPASLMVLLIAEIMIGVTLGLVARFIISVMHVAGMIISYNSGLALATQFDPSQGSQGSVLGNFLSLSAVLLLFSMDLHYVVLRGFVDSYTLFLPGFFPVVGDIAMYLSKLLSDVFTLGLKLAAPSITIGLMIYLCSGLLSRLMPNMQVFFVILPPQIFISFFILAVVFGALMLEFAEFFSDRYYHFLEGEM